MAAFDSDAFDTDAFDTDAFDFDSVAATPADAWVRGVRVGPPVASHEVVNDPVDLIEHGHKHED